MMAAFSTIAQRGEAFVVQTEGDRALDLAQVYDSALRRLYPRLPAKTLTSAPVQLISAADAPGNLPKWVAPSRQITDGEIAAAERVDLTPSDFLSYELRSRG